MSEEEAPSGAAVGWYRDPADHKRHRFWTGTAWLTQEDGLAHEEPD